MDAALRAQIARREATLSRIREILVNDLHVALPPEAIDADAPLFGTGIGLDSVDGLELVVAAEATFRVRIPEPALRNGLRTVNSLADLLLDLEGAREAA